MNTVLAYSRFAQGRDLILCQHDGEIRLALRQDLVVVDDSCVFDSEDAAYKAFDKVEARLEKEARRS